MSQPLAVVEAMLPDATQAVDALPVVIVGNGPVGMHTARELLRRRPDIYLVIYGDEQHQPYNRVRLSSLLLGNSDWEELLDRIVTDERSRIEERFGIAVTAIDPQRNLLEDSSGRRHSYQTLVLATGSRPHIPNIPGISLPGVFTFRNLDDTSQLVARRARSHHTVVLGGGLLGMEVARGMQRGNTRVTLIEHADRLLGVQLDDRGSRQLKKRVAALGIDIIIGNGVKRVLGDARVEGVALLSGELLKCDTLIIAAGIRPRIELARQAGLAIGKGIRVGDTMQTSVANIYAVGECAEHRDRVYGLVAPGLEQAGVAACHITGQGTSGYTGSITSSRLKVVDCPLFSAGPMGAGEDPFHGHDHTYADPQQDIYRKIKIHRHRLVGAIGIGAWDEDTRLQQAIACRQIIWPWQLLRFKRRGLIWPEGEQQGVTHWPATTHVCVCTGATRGSISEAIRAGAQCPEAVGVATGAGTVCGSCRPLVMQLLGDASVQPAPWHRTLLGSALLSLIAVLAILLLPAIPYPDTVQVEWRWDVLWREGLVKQISGFTVLGLFLLGLALSPRKRVAKWQSLGKFESWRLVHILLGLLVIALLIGHTGGRLGSGLNYLLMLGFSSTLLLGSLASGVIGLEHKIGGALATRLRRKSVWWHILAFWPVPALLGFHIFKGYWY
jgi:nitrite reductase (NADH) large subunit